MTPAPELIYVTGKGGSGKTTVATALATAAALSGRRTVLCAFAGGEGLTRRGDDLWSLTIDPRSALIEWMRSQPGGGVAAAMLGHSRGFAHFVEAAPGVKELVALGKVIDLARRADPYDLVVVDGPSTGHALAMLNTPHTIAQVAHHGPIGVQARPLHEFLADPRHTTFVGVTLPEEMSLHELLDLDAGLRDAVGRGVDLIVVDGVYPDRFTDAEADGLRSLADRAPSGPVAAALAEHRQARLHADRVAWLGERVAAPIVTLPFVFGAEIGAEQYREFADVIASSPARDPRRAGRHPVPLPHP
jgi:hypothetical protein